MLKQGKGPQLFLHVQMVIGVISTNNKTNKVTRIGARHGGCVCMCCVCVCVWWH